MSSSLVAPASGWMRRPSTISRAHFAGILGAVDRISGLKGHDAIPASLGEDAPGLLGREVVRRQLAFFVKRQVKDVDAPPDVILSLLVDGPYSGVTRIVDTVDLPGFDRLVGLVDLSDLDGGDRPILVRERDLRSVFEVVRFDGADGECNRDRPDKAACEAHLSDDPIVLRLVHKPF